MWRTGWSEAEMAAQSRSTREGIAWLFFAESLAPELKVDVAAREKELQARGEQLDDASFFLDAKEEAAKARKRVRIAEARLEIADALTRLGELREHQAKVRASLFPDDERSEVTSGG